MVQVTRRAIGRSPLLDAPIDSPRFTYKLEEKWYDTFFERYPAVTTATDLARELLPTLARRSIDAPADLLERLRKVTPSTLRSIAHWSRVERAHQDAHERAQRGEIYRGPSITYPLRQEMPAPLAELIAAGIIEEKRKRRRIVHSRT